jgi:hypothetical protein
MEGGVPYVRRRWRQVEDVTTQADPEYVELLIPQPKACELYYQSCAMIDRHNRNRQDTLQLEKKLETDNWSMRVNMSILGMVLVDSWLAFTQCTNSEEKQKDFYILLSEELIDNNYDRTGGRSRRQEDGGIGSNSSPTITHATGAPRSGIYAHLTPTKRRKKKSNGELTRYSYQGRCKVCGRKTIYICSQCMDEDVTNGATCEVYICYTNKGRLCYSEHMHTAHSV